MYVCAARDDVSTAMADIASEIQQVLQAKANHKSTGRRQSLLLLYEGCRMLLDGKTCATLGLMNGTEVIVEHIMLDERDQSRFARAETNEPLLTLKHMPLGLMCRAPQEKWVLPKHLLPGVPDDLPLHKSRGLFLVRPSPSGVFTYKHAGIKYRVKRTQFAMVPANAVIV